MGPQVRDEDEMDGQVLQRTGFDHRRGPIHREGRPMAFLTEERKSSVRDWVLAREPGTCFMSSEVPGRPETVAVTVSRLAGSEGPIVRPHLAVVGRIPKGLPDILLTSRPKPHRSLLAPIEAAVLEGVRDCRSA